MADLYPPIAKEKKQHSLASPPFPVILYARGKKQHRAMVREIAKKRKQSEAAVIRTAIEELYARAAGK